MSCFMLSLKNLRHTLVFFVWNLETISSLCMTLDSIRVFQTMYLELGMLMWIFSSVFCCLSSCFRRLLLSSWNLRESSISTPRYLHWRLMLIPPISSSLVLVRPSTLACKITDFSLFKRKTSTSISSSAQSSWMLWNFELLENRLLTLRFILFILKTVHS